MKEKLTQFLQELIFNKNISIEQDLETRIDMDYVIERLKDILGDE